MVVPNSPNRIYRTAVLLVNEETKVRDSLERALRTTEEEYDVFCASSAGAALSILESRTIDVLVSDLALSGEEGFSLLTTVKSRWPDTVRLALPDESEIPPAMKAVRECLLCGYLTKPCEEKELLLLIKTALDRKGREKARWLLEKRTASLERSVSLTSGLEPFDIDNNPI
jgi:two-component system response regulator HupR/HoxA